MRRLTLLLLLSITATGCRLNLPPGDFTTPEYWSDVFLDLYADDLVVGELEPGPGRLEAPRTVLLITGVTIRARWFDPIVARLERDGFRPVVYEPPALLSYDLFEATEDLAEVIERVREESGQDRIDILAECTGGVIARHYIQSMDGHTQVARMVTFVSPQAGIDKAGWAAAIAGWPALYDLMPGSEFLRAVNDPPLPEETDFTSIYTCADEYIQPYRNSIIPGGTNIDLCDIKPMGHFETFLDPDVYGLMHAALVRPLSHPPAEPEVAEPEAAEPEAMEPEAAEPEAMEPEAMEPEAAEPEAMEPEAAEPEAAEPEAAAPVGDDPPIVGEFVERAPGAPPEVIEVPAESGGCAIEPGTGAPGWPFALATLALLRRRRRA